MRRSFCGGIRSQESCFYLWPVYQMRFCRRLSSARHRVPLFAGGVPQALFIPESNVYTGWASVRSVYQRREKLVVISPRMATPHNLPIPGSRIIKGPLNVYCIKKFLLYSQTICILIVIQQILRVQYVSGIVLDTWDKSVSKTEKLLSFRIQVGKAYSLHHLVKRLGSLYSYS